MSDPNQILKQIKETMDRAVDEAKRNRRFLDSVSLVIVDMIRPILNKIADDSKSAKNDIVDAIRNFKVEINPEFKIPEIKVPSIIVPDIKSPEVRIPEIKIPPIKIPHIKVPRPEVAVNVPEIKIPKIIVPETKVEIPENLSVSLKDVDYKHPLPVILTDLKGNPYISSGGSGARIISTKRRSADLNISSINIAAAGDNTVITGVAGQSIKIYKIFFICNTAVNIILKNGASINMTGTMNFTANGSITLDYDDEPWFRLANGNDFIINLSSAQQVSGLIHYIQNNE